MIGLFCFVLAVLASPFKSKLRLEAENAVLRHQLNVLRRRLHGRVRLTNNDRWFFYPAVPLGSVDPAGPHDHPARDAPSLASAPAFAATGVGRRAHWEGGRRSRRSCAR